MRTPGGREISWLTVGVAAAAAFFVGVVLVVALRGFEPGEPASAGTTRATTTRSAPAQPVTPDVTGLPLDAAESVLEDAGLETEVDRGGGAFGIVVRSNWRVVEQAPASGAAEPPAGEPVRLAVTRR